MTIVSISGTPGTGKTEVARILAEKLNEKEGFEKWRLIDLNKMAEQKKLYSGYDRKRECKIVDIDALSQEIGRIGDQDIIVESHYAHEMPADLIIILGTKPGVLRERLKARGWKTAKVEENVLAEIMEVCKSEALETGKSVFEVDTTKNKPEKAAEEILNIIRLAPPKIEGDLRLPGEMKPEFRRPFGELIPLKGSGKKCAKQALKAAGKPKRLVTVGDPVTYYMVGLGRIPDMAIIDGREKRKPFKKKIELDCPEIRVKNPPGGITRELWETIERFANYKKKIKIFVEGEEDLAVLPCTVLMPEGSVILYGIPDKGIVVVKLTKEKKGESIKLLKRIMELQ